jgi:hypothetical protein
MSRASLCFCLYLTASLSPLPTDANAAQKGPVNTGPGSLTAARKYLEGRWSLVAYDIFPPGKAPIHLEGAGTLTYDDFGNLQVEIRVDPALADRLEDAGIPIRDGRLSMSGRTAIDLQARTLTYVFAGQPPLGAPSGPLALNRPRHWQVDGRVLTLTTKDGDGQPLSVARWEKAE